MNPEQERQRKIDEARRALHGLNKGAEPQPISPTAPMDEGVQADSISIPADFFSIPQQQGRRQQATPRAAQPAQPAQPAEPRAPRNRQQDGFSSGILGVGERIADGVYNFAAGAGQMPFLIGKMGMGFYATLENVDAAIRSMVSSQSYKEIQQHISRGRSLDERPVYQFFDEWQNRFTESLSEARFNQSPEMDEAFWQTEVPMGLGSMVSYVVLGTLTGGKSAVAQSTAAAGRMAKLMRAMEAGARNMARNPATYVAGGSMAVSAYEETRAAGFEDDVAMRAAYWAIPSGVIQVANVIRLSGKLDKALKGKLGDGIGNYIKEGVISGLNEALVEALGTATYNVTLQQIWDEDRDLLEGVLRSAQVGGASGGISGFLIALLGGVISKGRVHRPANLGKQAQLNVQQILSEIAETGEVPGESRIDPENSQPGDLIIFTLGEDELAGIITQRDGNDIVVRSEDDQLVMIKASQIIASQDMSNQPPASDPPAGPTGPPTGQPAGNTGQLPTGQQPTGNTGQPPTRQGQTEQPTEKSKFIRIDKGQIDEGDFITYEYGLIVDEGFVSRIQRRSDGTILSIDVITQGGDTHTVRMADVISASRFEEQGEGNTGAGSGEQGATEQGEELQQSPQIPSEFTATAGTGRSAVSVSFDRQPDGTMRSRERYERMNEAQKAATKLNEIYPGLVFEATDFRNANDPFSRSEVGITARVRTEADDAPSGQSGTKQPGTGKTGSRGSQKPNNNKGDNDESVSGQSGDGQEETSDQKGVQPGQGEGEGQSRPQVAYAEHEKAIREALGDQADTATIEQIIKAVPDIPEKTARRFVQEQADNRAREERRKKLEEERRNREEKEGTIGESAIEHAGKEVSIIWEADKPNNKVQARYGLIEGKKLQPSHTADGRQNPGFKIKKIQPRDRSADASIAKVNKMAQSLDPEQMGAAPQAFFGAPTTLPDGQVIQGHGRSAAIKLAMAEFKTNYGNYKKWLADNAEEFGFTREQVDSMENPVLVRYVEATVPEAIHLGNLQNTSELETSIIDRAKAAYRQLTSEQLLKIANIFRSAQGDTLKAIIHEHGHELFKLMPNVDRSYLVEDGKVTSRGYEFLENLMIALVFDGKVNPNAVTQYLNLPHHLREGIAKAFGEIIRYVNTDADYRGLLQAAVDIIDRINKSDGRIESVLQFMTQMEAVTDADGNISQIINSEKYTAMEAGLADVLLKNANKQSAVTNIFREITTMIEGYADMFEQREGYGATKNGIEKSLKELYGKQKSPFARSQDKGENERTTGSGTGNTGDTGQSGQSEKAGEQQGQPEVDKTSEGEGQTGEGQTGEGQTGEGTGTKKLKLRPRASEIINNPPDSTSPTNTTETGKGTGKGSAGDRKKSDKYKVKGDKGMEDLKNLIEEFGNIGRDQLSMGIDPRAIIQAGKIIAKGAEVGYNRFQQYLNFMIENFGVEYFKKLFSNFKAAYLANKAMTGNPEGEDLNQILALTPEQAIENYNKEVFEDSSNDTNTADDLESDSSQSGISDGERSEVVPDDGGGSGGGTGQGSQEIIREGIQQGSDGLSDGDSSTIGASGDNSLPGDPEPTGSTSGTTGDNDSGGSPTDSQGGALDEGQRGERPQAPYPPRVPDHTSGLSLAEKIKLQREVEEVPVLQGDMQNIAETLPVLLPQQREDVWKAETRFGKKSTYEKPTTGMLFTNGTGTGKTYTGLGIIKRFHKQGKKNILIVVPQQKKVVDWVGDGRNLLLEIRPLENTQDGGSDGEIIITTYANFRANERLKKRNFDLVIYDESHKLMSAGSFDSTASLEQHYYVTNAYSHSLRKAKDRVLGYIEQVSYGNATGYQYRDFAIVAELEYEADGPNIYFYIYEKGKKKDYLRHGGGPDGPLYTISPGKGEAKEIIEHETFKRVYEKREEDAKGREKELEKFAEELYDTTKVVFLSATPFSYHPNLIYADGYLFYIEQGPLKGDDRGGGYNSGGRLEGFYMRNFGYRMRYNKLTAPDAEVNVSMMERNFHKDIENEGAVSTRMLDLEQDYSREFILLDSELGTLIDTTLAVLQEDYGHVYTYIRKKHFTYLRASQFLESIKAEKMVPRIQQHLDMGRKVVLFHTYRTQEPIDIFEAIRDLAKMDEHFAASSDLGEAQKQAKDFIKNYPDLMKVKLPVLQNPVEIILKKFGERAAAFNGSLTNRQKNANITMFNMDNSGVDVLIVNYDAGKEGISMHDKTGRHTRVLINLGLPVKPTDSIQAEGRIYRVGQRSNAIFEYPVLHLNFEHVIFAQRIAARASTAENLAMGERARRLKDRYKEGYSNAAASPVSDQQGKGGKELDRAFNEITDYDQAKSIYFGKQKRNSTTKAAEGVDYFATPEPVGFKMVEWLYAQMGESLLEPSVGDGAIGRWFPDNTTNHYVEPSVKLAAIAQVNVDSGTMHTRKFEDYHLINKFDGIAMNPPFGSNSKTAFEHVVKALKHLKDKGRVIAIVPDGPSMQKRLDSFYESNDSDNFYIRAEIKLPAVTFERAGTKVMTKILVIDRIDQIKDVQNMGSQVQLDYTPISSINELFDRLVGVSMPERIRYKNDEGSTNPTTASETDSQPVTVSEGVSEALKVIEGKHTRDHYPIWTVKINDYLDRDVFIKLKVASGKFGGYYSSYTGRGAIPGFIFKSAEDANKFLQHVDSNNLLGLDGNLNAESVSDNTTTYGVQEGEVRFQLSPEDVNITYGSARQAEDNINAIVAEARGAKYNAKNQLDLFKALPGLREQRKKGEARKAADFIDTPDGRIYKNMLEEFEMKGAVSAIGMKIGSIQDVMDYYHIYRSPLIERFFMVATDDKGTVVGQIGLTSASPTHVSVSKLDTDLFFGNARLNGATKFYITHNHPSGNHTPSLADINLTADFAVNALMEHGLELGGHVVFDHDRVTILGGMAQLSDEIRNHAYQERKKDPNIKESVLITRLKNVLITYIEAKEEVRTVNYKNFRKSDGLNTSLDNRTKLVNSLGNLLMQDNLFVVYLDSFLRVAGYKTLPYSTTLEQFKAGFERDAAQNGATRVFVLAGQDSKNELIDAAVEPGMLLNSVLYGDGGGVVLDAVIADVRNDRHQLSWQTETRPHLFEMEDGRKINGQVYMLNSHRLDELDRAYKKRNKQLQSDKSRNKILIFEDSGVRYQLPEFQPMTTESAAERLPFKPDRETIRQRLHALLNKTSERTRNIAAELKEILAVWNIGDNVVLAEHIGQIPPHLREHILRNKAIPGGIYDGQTGKSYVIVFAHPTTEAALKAFMHEVVGHAGLRGMLSYKSGFDKKKYQKEFNEIMDRIAEAFADSPDFQAIAARYRADLKTAAGRRLAAEEYIAKLAETMEGRGYLKQLRDWLVRVLRALGIGTQNFTESDLYNMLRNAKLFVKEQGNRINLYTPLVLNNQGGFQKSIAGEVGIRFSLSSDLEKMGWKPEYAQRTQISGTKATYEKLKGIIGKKRDLLDYGAGRGHGAEILGAKSFEPFPKVWQPDFVNPADINEQYDAITNMYVLNVVPDDIRASILEHIGALLKKGGTAYIATRGRGTYQKGFTQEELESYVSSVLGEGFVVEPLKIGSPAAVQVRKTKLAEDDIRFQIVGENPNVPKEARNVEERAKLLAPRHSMRSTEDIERESQLLVGVDEDGWDVRFQLPSREEYEIINGFYSPIEKRLAETKRDRQSAKWWSDFVGKKEEAEWTGVRAWLDSINPSQQVSKEEIWDFMRENRIVVKTKELSRDRKLDSNRLERIDAYYATSHLNPIYQSEKYLSPGEYANYKEVLVTLPNKDTFAQRFDITKDDEGNYILEDKSGNVVFKSNIKNEQIAIDKFRESYGKESDRFRSEHFTGTPNILVHLRMNTRIDTEGYKVLFLEELQSDWAQEGRKDGFSSGERVGNFESFIKDVKKLDWDNSKIRMAFKEKDSPEYNEWHKIHSQQFKTPPAPFVTKTNNWVKLGLKVAMQQAVSQGADYISWTTGEQQAQRYNLFEYIDRIEYEQIEVTPPTFKIIAYDRKGKELINKDEIGLDRIQELFGKDIAERIKNKEREPVNSPYRNWYVLPDLELEIGGEGMKAFYGSKTNPGIVGSIAKSLLKGEIETITINDHEQPAIRISPEIYDEVQAGLPMFQLPDPANQQLPVDSELRKQYFKKWFGESKVVDENDEPLVVYHGTNESFTEFSEQKTSYGYFFTPDEKAASFYGRHNIQAYLKIINPADLRDPQNFYNNLSDSEKDDLGFWIEDYFDSTESFLEWLASGNLYDLNVGRAQSEFIQEIEALGFDGVIFNDARGGGGIADSYVVFNPNQIKSATDNAGTFDANNPDIRFSLPAPGTSIADLVENRRVPGGLGRIARLKGFFIEPLHWLEQKKDLQPLAKQVRDHFDRWAERRGKLYGKMHREILKPLGSLSRKQREAVMGEFETFMRLRETDNKQQAYDMRPTVHPITEAMIKYSEFIGEYAGKLNQALNVQVFDPKQGKWRPIGRIKEFFPRKLNRLTEATLRNPHNFPEHWNALIEGLVDEGFVTSKEEADEFLQTYIANYTEFNYFAGIEKARGNALPSIAYDYGFNVLADYMDRWSERISQIEHFGQVTTPDTMDAFDAMIERVADEKTRRFIREIKNRVENNTPQDGYHKITSFLSRLATGLQLGNFGTATLNIFGGTTLNFMAFPVKANIKALGHLIKPSLNLDFTNKSVMQALKDMIEFKNLADMIDEGRYRGAITNDMLNLLRDTNNVEGFLRTPELLKRLGYKSDAIDFNEVLTKYVNYSLKFGGYTGTEMFIRSHAQLTAKYMLREGLDAFAKKPTSRKALTFIRMIQEHGFDYRDLLSERHTGGAYTERYIRYMSNLTQGSYKIDQVPIHLDTPLGRFFFKYMKFISQASRLWYKDFYKPFIASLGGGSKVKVEVDGVMTTQRVREFGRMLKYFGVAAVGGEIVRTLRNQLFGNAFVGPMMDELEKALEDDDRWRLLSLIFERAFWNIQATGGLTIFGNYWQLTQDTFSRERSRNPLEPPGYSIAINTGRFALDIFDQGGRVTARQIDNFIQQQVSMYRTTKRLAMNVTSAIDDSQWRDAMLYQAQLDRRDVRALIRRYEQSEGIAGARTRTGRIGRTGNSIMNERIHEALSMQEPGEAFEIFMREARRRPEKVVSLAQSVSASMRYRRPVGNRSAEDIELFFEWLANNATETNAKRIRRIHEDYQQSYDAFWKHVQGVRNEIRPINEEIERLQSLNQTPAVAAELQRQQELRYRILNRQPISLPQ